MTANLTVCYNGVGNVHLTAREQEKLLIFIAAELAASVSTRA
jgi:hypothetical protein